MSSQTQYKFNMHDLLMHGTYDNAVLCTYTFETGFFEEYCLERFNSLKNNSNISIIVDADTYRELIAAPLSTKPRQANIRYLLHSVSVPGRFHPKLFLLVSKNKGRLIVGSANFTRSGLTQNAEIINFYDFETEKNEIFLSLFQSAFHFLNNICNRWPNDSLFSNLSAISRTAPWLIPEQHIIENNDSNFLLHNLDVLNE